MTQRIGATPAALVAGVVLTAALALVSVFVGVADVTPGSLLRGGPDSEAALLLAASRLPRTIALVLAGAASAIAGLIMQMLVRNRFVEPGTTGTTEAAALGLLVVTVSAPGLPLTGKMAVAIGFALVGTALFLLLLRRVPVRSVILVPLVGIMLGSVIGAVTTFFAYRLDLFQTLDTWLTGDFSGVLRGRYELLWVAFAATVAAWVAADRLTVAGLGRDFTTNLGMHYGRLLALGVTVVATVASVVVVTVGAIPFLGLIVPNIVSLVLGDNARRAIPWVAVAGAAFVLACDLIGRVVRYPYEIPLGVVVGVVGAAVFLYLLLRSSERAH
ncbi:ABC transporter permease [Salinispora arenicola]|uniref:Iron ABC transporter permease n=1 Tax=Salinispora arenicola TaxID=168697 RepID=A0A542XSC2_SALAC|nr:iron chelate uptake ABC transporter family permease subunit [Salinispora arenicola]MCN0155065.1 iron chelate uptake ABC transporter family permease subunit [Salinispora arenicola]TQL38724.1 iron complex transport system permease protein [Salinispora arenicola]GIM85831.1 iron ABC transporter permease [Salinispora arenicola]